MGAYLEITSITGPSEANYGDTVTLNVYVKNVWTGDIMYATVTANSDGIKILDLPNYRINAGQTIMWPVTFTMPNESIVLAIGAFYWGTGEEWVEADHKYISISLVGEEPPPEIDGVIEGLKVYAEGTAPVTPPLLNVTPGKKVSIKFDAHSGYGSFPFGLWFDAYAILKKPVSGSQSRYDRSETGPYSKCTLDHFDFSYDWTADEKGTYYADIILKARSSLIGSSVEVNRKTNIKVFTVTQDIPLPDEYAGRITNPQVRWGISNWRPAPATIEQGQGFSIAFTGYNDSSIALVLKGEYELTYPSGKKASGSMISYLTEIPFIEKTIGPGKSWTPKWDEYGKPNDFVADEAGDYTAKFSLYGKKAGEPDSAFRELCTPWEDKILVVTETEPPPDGEEAEFDGHIGIIYVDQTGLPGGEQAIPVIGVSGRGARVSFHGHNDDPIFPHTLCAKLWIYGPAPVLGQQAGITHGPLKYYYEDCSNIPVLPRGNYWSFVFPSAVIPPGGQWFQIDQDGQWTVKVRLEDSHGGLLDSKEEILFSSAEEAAPSSWGILIDMMPLIMIMMVMAMIVPMTKELGAGE